MADPLLEDYSYEIKENLARRAIALFIDLIILSFVMVPISFIIIYTIFQANPLSTFIGVLADLVYKYEVYGVESTSLFVAMIPNIFIVPIVTGLYYTIFGSNGRRTLGKKLQHLDVLRSDGKFPTPMQAFRRNIVKYIAGALGFYLMGLLGMGLFIGLICLLDLKLFPSKKKDVRQRMSETFIGTMVHLEHDEVPIGEISIPGEKVQETKEKKRKPRPVRKPSLSPKKGTLDLIGGDEEDDILLPREKKKPLLLAGGEEEEKPGIAIPVPEEEEGEVEEGEVEEIPKKVGFFTRLFGGGKKKVEEEESETSMDGKEPIGLPPRKEIGRDEIVLQFMFDFDISEERARGLYDMGYRSKPEFKDAIPQDLMMVDGINPTIAKRIVALANE